MVKSGGSEISENTKGLIWGAWTQMMVMQATVSVEHVTNPGSRNLNSPIFFVWYRWVCYGLLLA